AASEVVDAPDPLGPRPFLPLGQARGRLLLCSNLPGNKGRKERDAFPAAALPLQPRAAAIPGKPPRWVETLFDWPRSPVARTPVAVPQVFSLSWLSGRPRHIT